MAKNLVIVESPAKAATIQKFLGPDYQVAASFGHVRDLPKKGMSIDIEHNFEPSYEVGADKKKVVAGLKKAAKGATVWLASDEDREGEAIAWHLCSALGIDPKNTKRIVFHEITKPAILEAVANPRSVDVGLVDAQQARRVLDRLVGYELSPVLWKKVRPGLSAGRVQSVAVRLIVEREREIEGFESTAKYKVTAEFEVGDSLLKAELTSRLGSLTEVKDLLKGLVGSSYSVESLATKPGTRNPAAPFTTSTLQQEASRKLGFSVRQTMTVAQRLYEAGLITYMRTDSVNLSQTALAAAAIEITKRYGKQYAEQRSYKTKSAGAQEAHEAIRPTEFGRDSMTGDSGQRRLYELIWQRAIASQMATAKLEKTTVTVAPTNNAARFSAAAEMVMFDGFLKVYLEGRDDEDEDSDLLPPLKKGQALPLKQIIGRETFNRPKARYTEASLVRQLEEMGIGRPSTYAPTISTIQDREYVLKADVEGKQRQVDELTFDGKAVVETKLSENYGADRNKLLPTPTGEVVTDFLVKYFPHIIDYQFTADSEASFDDIEEGKRKWQEVIAAFYGPFHETVTAVDGLSRQEVSQARLVGNHPKNGKPIYARIGRFGPMLQMGETTDEKKPLFAPIPDGAKMGDVTIEMALKLFELPRILGQTAEGEDIGANFGPFGPYVKAGTTSVSIRPDDPFSVTLERARELIVEKREAAAKALINDFGGGIKVLIGRYGPYITDGKKNAKIPKDQDPTTVDAKQAAELLAAAPARKARKRVRKA